jgi:starch phosphorylase
MKIKVNNVNEPNWKVMNVKSNLPGSLKKLDEIAQNLWWVWNSEAKNMFRAIDAQAWIEANSNPVQLLNILSYEKLVSLGNDAEFIAKLNKIYADFERNQFFVT